MAEAARGAALLALLQVADSQLPVGAFAHSAGLETYAQGGLDRAGLEALLRHGLVLGSGRLDGAALVLAMRAEGSAELERLADELAAWRPAPSLRARSLRIGGRSERLLTRLYPDLRLAPLPRPFQPLVLGRWAAAAGIDEAAMLAAFLHGELKGALAAATRCMALSPEQAQEILLDLHPAVLVLVGEIAEDPDAALWSATPAADLAALRQPTLASRLFES